ncbi:MAG: molybdopterin-guanine dinucleotide biosynthesis protein B [Coriobacteriia bacterium]|nr:molybdopterin-guanine dinucleotide biosynthesis protein B [Coriobacteriia bacterium]
MAEKAGVPVVSIVGKSDSGKTTVVEQLVRRLVDRGHRVATCKHHVHEVDIDVPGKDSWRHARAGAQVTMISAPTQFAVVSKVDRERTLEEIVHAAGDVDILVTEGFKRAGSVRIEVARRARSDELISTVEELTALITDHSDLQPEGVLVFGLNDYDALTDFVERTFLGGKAPYGD